MPDTLETNGSIPAWNIERSAHHYPDALVLVFGSSSRYWVFV